MKAVKLHAKNDLRIDKIEKSAPKAGEILIKIGTAGVCHSDLHMIHSGIPDEAPVLTLGHDNASWIKELGEGVTDFKVEEAVIVYAVWGCGHCAPCQQSQENYCELQIESPIFGGCMAEYMIVSAGLSLMQKYNLLHSPTMP